MKLSVFDDRLIVELDSLVVKTKFGIDLPEIHSERTRIGTIIEGGDKIAPYKVGDRILIQWHTGAHLHFIRQEINGVPASEDRHRILCAHEILARVDEE